MNVELIQRKTRLTKSDLIRMQLLMEICFFNKQLLIESDLAILCLLAEWGSMDLNEFCQRASAQLHSEQDAVVIYRRSQGIRNRLSALETRGLVVKSGPSTKKTVSIASFIAIVTTAPIRLEYHQVCLDV